MKKFNSKYLTILNAGFILYSLFVMVWVYIKNGNSYYVDDVLKAALFLNPIFLILEIITAKVSKGRQRACNCIFIVANILLFLILFYFQICIWCSRG